MPQPIGDVALCTKGATSAESRPPAEQDPGASSRPADHGFTLRKDAIASLIRVRGTVSVAELVSIFGVSSVTVRRDLRDLHVAGVIHRFHGGAANRC